MRRCHIQKCRVRLAGHVALFKTFIRLVLHCQKSKSVFCVPVCVCVCVCMCMCVYVCVCWLRKKKHKVNYDYHKSRTGPLTIANYSAHQALHFSVWRRHLNVSRFAFRDRQSRKFDRGCVTDKYTGPITKHRILIITPTSWTGIFFFFKNRNPPNPWWKWNRLHFFFKNRPIILTHPDQSHMPAEQGSWVWKLFWEKTSPNDSPCSESCSNMFTFHQKCLENFTVKILDSLPCAFFILFFPNPLKTTT